MESFWSSGALSSLMGGREDPQSGSIWRNEVLQTRTTSIHPFLCPKSSNPPIASPFFISLVPLTNFWVLQDVGHELTSHEVGLSVPHIQTLLIPPSWTIDVLLRDRERHANTEPRGDPHWWWALWVQRWILPELAETTITTSFLRWKTLNPTGGGSQIFPSSGKVSESLLLLLLFLKL